MPYGHMQFFYLDSSPMVLMIGLETIHYQPIAEEFFYGG